MGHCPSLSRECKKKVTEEKGLFHPVETSGLLLLISILRNRFAVREDDVAALVDGAGFQFGAGAADGEGVGAAAAITRR